MSALTTAPTSLAHVALRDYARRIVDELVALGLDETRAMIAVADAEGDIRSDHAAGIDVGRAARSVLVSMREARVA